MDRQVRIEITPKNVLVAIMMVLATYFVYQIREILFLLFISILFMSGFNPVVSRLEKLKISRAAAIGMAYVGFFVVMSLIVMMVVPPLINETSQLIDQFSLPQSLKDDLNNFDYTLENVQLLASQLYSLPRILGVIGSAFSSVLYFVSLFAITFYLLLERKNLHQHLKFLFETEAELKAERFVERIEHKIGGWVRGQLMLMSIIGAMTFVGLVLLRIPYALPLALLAGLLEVLPNVGPTISAIPAIIIAFLVGGWPLSLATLALYILVQQLENHLIVPQVMRVATGINPIVTIVTMLTGFKLGGVSGAILAIPLYIVIQSTLTEWYHFKKLK